MRVVEVDAVGVQARERGLRGGANVRGRETRLLRVFSDLGGEHYAFAGPWARGEPFAEDALRLAAGVARREGAVGVRRVDEVPAAVEEGVEHSERRIAIRGPAEDVAA